ncbi:MAG: aspartate/glutamate racemase family protein [Anaerolineae bacterium]|nr:aspartate/glutamate racemase family protein [Anaerolineae bacterium]
MTDPALSGRPIGLLDSGVGGLSILREVRAQLPAEHLLYLADQAHVPYGPRSIEQVRAFTEGIARFLIAQGVKLIVVACNTASAAALHPLRAQFPDMPFVGMEPAVKPAASRHAQRRDRRHCHRSDLPGRVVRQRRRALRPGRARRDARLPGVRAAGRSGRDGVGARA